MLFLLLVSSNIRSGDGRIHAIFGLNTFVYAIFSNTLLTLFIHSLLKKTFFARLYSTFKFEDILLRKLKFYPFPTKRSLINIYCQLRVCTWQLELHFLFDGGKFPKKRSADKRKNLRVQSNIRKKNTMLSISQVERREIMQSIRRCRALYHKTA